MLITESYRDLNIRLHRSGRYGLWGDKWASTVTELVRAESAADVLDYGCGQGSLARAVEFPVREYDPAIEEKSAPPDPADIVICTDVMEHIEPELLPNVLNHLQSLTRKALFLVISIRPAAKTLEDGRNAHLIVEPPAFWRAEFEKHFLIRDWQVLNDEVITTVVPRPNRIARDDD